MEENVYNVYVKTDEHGFITQIDSEIFLDNTEGWLEIDKGSGDRYAHAQGNYFGKLLTDMFGNYQYRLVDGKIIEEGGEESE